MDVIVQPDTLRRWHRELVERNRFKNPQRKTGRPSTDQEIVDLALRMARENPSWGYKRIEGALSNVGYSICSSTVANILKHHGVEPAPQRQHHLSWGVFLKAHMDAFEEVGSWNVISHLVAGIFAWPTIILDHIRNALSESDLRIEELLQEISDRDWVVQGIPKSANTEGHVGSCEDASIESHHFTRGPPTLCDRCKSSPSSPYAKAA